MLSLHAGQGAMDDLGDRFVACFMAAVDEAQLPDDPQLRSTLRDYMVWATDEVMALSPHGSTVPDGLAVPQWGWEGLCQG